MQTLHIIINLCLTGIAIYLTKKGLEAQRPAYTDQTSFDLKPYQINYLYSFTSYMDRAILTTILDLYRRSKLDIQAYKRESRNKRKAPYVIEYKLSLLDCQGLDSIEEEFINLTFQDQTTTDTDQIRQRSKNDGQAFFKSFGTWTLMIEASLKDQGYITDQTSQVQKNLYKLGIILAIISAVLLFASQNIFYLVSFFATFPVILIYMPKSLTKTDLGNTAYTHYQDLRAKLEAGQVQITTDTDFLEALALSLPYQAYQTTYPDPSPLGLIYLEPTNPKGGSHLDDAVQRAFLGYSSPTRAQSLDTSREILPRT